jgi:hypothetical protein
MAALHTITGPLACLSSAYPSLKHLNTILSPHHHCPLPIAHCSLTTVARHVIALRPARLPVTRCSQVQYRFR